MTIIELPDTTDISTLADWVELNILIKSDQLSKSDIISASGSSVDENQIDSLFNELGNRQKLFTYCPFKLEGKIVKSEYKWKDIPEYILCLYFSLYGASNQHRGVKLFERLCKEALKNYLNGKAVLIGFPSGKSLKEQIIDIAAECNLDIGSRDPLSSDNDRGIDVIGWIPHNDYRKRGQVVVMMQCGAGKHWHEKKPTSCYFTAWKEFIYWGIDLIPAMGTVETVDIQRWTNLVDEYGIIFDRVRIFELIRGKTYEDNTLKNDILDWCNQILGILT